MMEVAAVVNEVLLMTIFLLKSIVEIVRAPRGADKAPLVTQGGPGQMKRVISYS